MRPKKIYLNPKTIDQLSPTDGEGKTMRVRAFKGKNDAEYVDLSQVWHPISELPTMHKPVFIIGTIETENGKAAEARVSELVNSQVFESCETGFWHSVPEDAIWAYVADLPRPELMTIKNQ